MQLLYYVSHGEKIYNSKTPWKTVKIFESNIIIILPLKLKYVCIKKRILKQGVLNIFMVNLEFSKQNYNKN